MNWIKKRIKIWKGKQLHKRIERFFNYIDDTIYFPSLESKETVEMKELKECLWCQLDMHQFIGIFDYLLKKELVCDYETAVKKTGEEIIKRAKEKFSDEYD